jgi:1-acyl-sn-glycerol-3-phosphate acyltransferase
MASNNAQIVENKEYPVKPGLWYRIVRRIIASILWFLAGTKVRGLEHVSDEGPYLLVVNHIHWLDAPVLLVVFPYRAHVFAAAKRRDHWFTGPLFNSLDAIWIRRSEFDRQAIRQALARLHGGGVLGVAPEGTRSPTGGLQNGLGGAAYMAYQTGAPILPVAIWGQEKVFPSARRLRRTTIQVLYGPPFQPRPLPKGQKKASQADIRALTEEIMYRLAGLLPAEYRGLYADVVDKRPELVANPPHDKALSQS